MFEADSWVMEPPEPEPVSTATSEPVARQTEQLRSAAVQETVAPPQPTPQPRPWVEPVHSRPPRVEAIGIMMIVGGIIALSFAVGGWKFHIFRGFWPPAVYSLVLGVMAIIRGSRLMGRFGQLQPSPRIIAIMQIINIMNGDVPNLVMGIITLSFLKDPTVRRYFRPY
jgi:hypothetical protein